MKALFPGPVILFIYFIHPTHCATIVNTIWCSLHQNIKFLDTVKLGNKERFDKEQIGIKEPFPVTNLPFTL
jgi:hypothetical protein